MSHLPKLTIALIFTLSLFTAQAALEAKGKSRGGVKGGAKSATKSAAKSTQSRTAKASARNSTDRKTSKQQSITPSTDKRQDNQHDIAPHKARRIINISRRGGVYKRIHFRQDQISKLKSLLSRVQTKKEAYREHFKQRIAKLKAQIEAAQQAGDMKKVAQLKAKLETTREQGMNAAKGKLAGILTSEQIAQVADNHQAFKAGKAKPADAVEAGVFELFNFE